jgi:hypothetical protein
MSLIKSISLTLGYCLKREGPLLAESSHPESTYALPGRPIRWTSLVNIDSTDDSRTRFFEYSHGPVRHLACPARFERATYALEEFVAAGICIYFNDLDA